MIPRRRLEVVAILMIGDGVVTPAVPRRHTQLWRSGPKVWRKAMGGFAERPVLTRILAAAETLAGLWLALRQYRER